MVAGGRSSLRKRVDLRKSPPVVTFGNTKTEVVINLFCLFNKSVVIRKFYVIIEVVIYLRKSTHFRRDG